MLNSIIKIAVFGVIFSPIVSIAQSQVSGGLYKYQPNYLHQIFFSRQSSADAEALGKSSSFMDGNINAVHYNPAALSSMTGPQASFNNASPYYSFTKATLSSYAIGCRVTKKLALGVSYSSFNPNQKFNFWNEQEDELIINTMRLSGSFSLPKNLSVGASINYLDVYPGLFAESESYYGDLGILKKFELKKLKNKQSFNLSSSICNFTNSSATGSYDSIEFSNVLPMIWTSGVTYFHSLDKYTGNGLEILKIMATAEVIDLMNSEYNTQLSGGIQATIFEFLILRGGYFATKNYNYGQPSNKDKTEALTYGLGLNLPINKLTSIPLSITADYANMPQPSYVIGRTEDNFSSFSLSLKYDLGCFED